MMLIHDDDVATLDKLVSLGLRAATKFRLQLCTIEPKRRPSSNGAFGLCYIDEGRVSIVLRYRDGGQWWKNSLTWREVENTLVHELAHFRYPNHSSNHQILTAKIGAYVQSIQ